MITKRSIMFGLAAMIVCIASVNTFWVNPRINYSLSQWELLNKLSLPEEAESYLEDAKSKQSVQYALNFVLVILGISIFNSLLLKSAKKDSVA